MPPASKLNAQKTAGAVVVQHPPGSFGYINEDDPFGEDAVADCAWWELITDHDRVVTQEMLSEALWHALMRSAEQIRYKYIKHVPHCRDREQQQEQAKSMIDKLQLLEQLSRNWKTMNLLLPNAANTTWIYQTIEGMQASYQKRYDARRVY